MLKIIKKGTVITVSNTESYCFYCGNLYSHGSYVVKEIPRSRKSDILVVHDCGQEVWNSPFREDINFVTLDKNRIRMLWVI